MKIKFIKRIRRTEHITSFRFENSEKIAFIPGQFAKVIFDQKDISNKNLNKYLSFSCAPNKSYLEFSKRISSSDFSSKLMALSSGDEIAISKPMGKCTLGKNQKSVGFVIGGIGCTPAISILENLFETGSDVDINLFYGNANPDDIAYNEQLNKWREKLNMKITHVVMENPNNLAGFEVGLINAPIIKNNMPDFAKRDIFIFGPPIMVKVLKDVCLSIGCSPERIFAENFMGY